ncbi:putative non-specific serine/threonine protein kinase [Helianthus annuus]|nr:putative non-specific serine/threonine protein kinase [Helianthus annuus]KAJ0606905.1 putative non-specific serine/threonine protein kinase [Helianthus annuus]KAJ0766971.1 putative non-specific serine/threonine protein kinase [Helianthus annuus]
METRTNSRLDAHDAQIKQLQSDFAEFRISLQSVEKSFDVEKGESGEFRKVVLAWMAKQDKRLADDPLDSGKSDLGFEYSGARSRPGPSMHTDHSLTLPWAVKKSLLIYGQTGQLWSNSARGWFNCFSKSFGREVLVHLLLLLILDGTTGLNMLPQAGEFNEQLISGVSYCHNMKVCHHALKLENTLLDGSSAPHTMAQNILILGTKVLH